MAILTRDEILQADDMRIETVAVPEWGGEVRVKSLTGAERDLFEASITQQIGGKASVVIANMRAKLCAMAIVNENGVNLFSQADVETLGVKSAAALDRVFGVAQRLAGLSPRDVEELTGNFTRDRSGNSISDSL